MTGPGPGSGDPLARARRAVAEAHRLVAEGETWYAGQAGVPVGDGDPGGDPVARARRAVSTARRWVTRGEHRLAQDTAQAGRVARWHAEDQDRERERGDTTDRGAP